MSMDSKMNIANNFSNLSLLPPDNIEEPITHISNMPFDESIELHNTNYVSSPESMDISDESNNFDSINFKESYILPPPPPPVSPKQPDNKTLKSTQETDEEIQSRKICENKLSLNGINLGDGKMDYIENKHDKLMFTNAWQAITQTNTWNFVGQKIESFMWSTDKRVDEISMKMEELGYNGHSGCSFGYTLRIMQYLAKNGEDEFKKLFEKEKEPDIIHTNKINNFLEYTGGS